MYLYLLSYVLTKSCCFNKAGMFPQTNNGKKFFSCGFMFVSPGSAAYIIHKEKKAALIHFFL